MKEQASLKGKKKDSKEVNPVKAEPTTDKDGGILTAKVAAIVKKIKSKFKS